MRRRCRLAQALLVLVGMLLTACGAPAQADVARSERPRQAAPQVATEELRVLVAGNNRFALELYRSLAQQEGNLLFSPHSIAQALAMAYAGARSDTAAQMAQVMHIELADERFHAAHNARDLALASRAQAPPAGGDSQTAGFQLRVANSAWGQRDYRFEPAYLFISEALHQATITVDEDGTEASAATALVVTAGSAPPTDLVELTIDRPFIFLIRDGATGALLFMGRVLRP